MGKVAGIIVSKCGHQPRVLLSVHTVCKPCVDSFAYVIYRFHATFGFGCFQVGPAVDLLESINQRALNGTSLSL